MANPILIIDPGHGGSDPGAQGNGIIEKDYTLRISLYQYGRFQQLGVPVAMTRTEDVTLPPADRARVVRESRAAYCISNHINAAVSTARGAETIHSIHSDGRLARDILDALAEAGIPRRRVFTRQGANGSDYYYMHRETGAVETVIVEYGFATNAEDARFIIDRWEELAEAAVRAFCLHIGHPYTAPGANNPPQPEPPAADDWKLQIHNDAAALGVITSDWSSRLDEPAPVWMVLATHLNVLRNRK